MTAYLQPGDKIIVQAPCSVSGSPTDEQTATFITDEYAKLGIHVSAVFLVGPDGNTAVVSVVRAPQAPAPALPKRYRWSGPPEGHEHLPPWLEESEATEPFQAHPGYQDHPKVP